VLISGGQIPSKGYIYGTTKSSIYEFIIEDAMMMDIRYADELN